ncbi:MAG: hypothetical protein V4555_04940, partial [Acidobacteriota bacterium]
MQTIDPTRYQCRHIFTAGQRCGSPALRGEIFCYFHHGTRGLAARSHRDVPLISRSTFDFPTLEDRSSIQLALSEVLQRISSNHLDPRRAGLLLYGLQIASLNLPKPNPTADPIPTVDEIIHDPTLGPLAPTTEYFDPADQPGSAARILEEFLNDHEPVFAIEAPISPSPTQISHSDQPESAQPAVTQSASEYPEPAASGLSAPVDEASTLATTSIIPTIQAVAAPKPHSLLPTPYFLLPTPYSLPLDLTPTPTRFCVPTIRGGPNVLSSIQHPTRQAASTRKGNRTMIPTLISCTLLLAAAFASPQTLPANTTPPSNTFITAAETAIDTASAVDIHATDEVFASQMQQLRIAQENLKNMVTATSDREHDIFNAVGDLAFALNTCHIQTKNGPAPNCETRIAAARTTAMQTIGKQANPYQDQLQGL